MKKILALGLGVLALAFCFACAPKDNEPSVPNPDTENGKEDSSVGNGGADGGGLLGDNELPIVPFE